MDKIASLPRVPPDACIKLVDWLWKKTSLEKEGADNIGWLVYKLTDDNTVVSLF